MQKIFKIALAIVSIMGLLLMNMDIHAVENAKQGERQFTFNLAPGVKREQARFKNRFGIELCADVYKPISGSGKLPAIVVGGPYGAVKEQASGLYANELASQGFITLAFDPSYTGESGGEPRNMSSPDINTEDFSASVDYLANRPDVDAGKIGALGICGLGGAAHQGADACERHEHALGAIAGYAEFGQQSRSPQGSPPGGCGKARTPVRG